MRSLFVSSLIVCLAVLTFGSTAGHAQEILGHSFLYQGVITDEGEPANGVYDITLTLYDASEAGNMVGDPIELMRVGVTDGLFMVFLNFGSGPEIWNGEARWLELEVDMTVLTPRQPVRPAPYALALPGLRTIQSLISPSILGGYKLNEIGAGSLGAVVAGGGAEEYTLSHEQLDNDEEIADARNRALADFATVSGGVGNVANDISATVGGGAGNSATGLGATVSGGGFNTAAGGATVGGGGFNTASGVDSTIGGGVDNTAGGEGAAILGGTGNSASGEHATVGGGVGNSASALGTTISGGESNIALQQYGSVGGGLNITASGAYTAIAGGQSNVAAASHSTIAGGQGNTSSGLWSTVAGGLSNTASGSSSAVAGGQGNVASGVSAIVAGGRSNRAAGDMSFAAGRRARAMHIGSFVWGDSTNADFESTAINQFLIRASGNVGINTATPTHALHVEGTLRATGFRTSDNATSPNVVGGHLANQTALGTVGAFIGGGGVTAASNFIAATGDYGVIAGGRANTLSGERAVIGGGSNNLAQGWHSTIPGGSANRAAEAYTFAAGRNAKADHVGAFVWADSSEPNMLSTTEDQFTVRASGGVRMFTDELATVGATLAPGASAWSTISDRNAKRDIVPVDGREVLARLADVPVAQWSYIHDKSGTVHMGPMAQDFYEAFGLGHSDLHLTTLDVDGVALAAIKGLHGLVQDKDTEIAELNRRIEQLEAIVNRLAQQSEAK